MLRKVKRRKNEIQKIVYKALGLHKRLAVDDDDDLEQFGLDSLAYIKLIVGLEDALGISVPDEMLGIKHVRTISDIYKFVEEVKGRSGIC